MLLIELYQIEAYYLVYYFAIVLNGLDAIEIIFLDS